MKQYKVVFIMIMLLILSGCNKSNIHNDITSGANSDENLVGNPTSIPSINPTMTSATSQSVTPVIGSSDYIKTYKDETHKEINFGQRTIKLYNYHVVSDLRIDNINTFTCRINEGEDSVDNKMTISVIPINKQEFKNTENIITYLSEIDPNYDHMYWYENVNDKSGITNLYYVSEDYVSKYVVCLGDEWYLIESNSSILENYLLDYNVPEKNYEVWKQKIECADSNTTYVKEMLSEGENIVKYSILQGKNGNRYTAEVKEDKDENCNFSLKNSQGDSLLNLTTSGSEVGEAISIFDINMDGYADIQFMEDEGPSNCTYQPYLWDSTANTFVKVKCKEPLTYSDIEVHKGYLKCWGTNDSSSGVITKYVWGKNNTLIKKSEEKYHAD